MRFEAVGIGGDGEGWCGEWSMISRVAGMVAIAGNYEASRQRKMEGNLAMQLGRQLSLWRAVTHPEASYSGNLAEVNIGGGCRRL